MTEQQKIKMPPKTKESFFLYSKIFCTQVRIHKFCDLLSVGKLSFVTLKEYWKNLGRKFIANYVKDNAQPQGLLKNNDRALRIIFKKALGRGHYAF